MLTKYMKMDRNELNPVYQSLTVAGKSFERVKEFAYLGALITDRNYIKSELKRRTRSGNACYYSVQKLLATRLLSKKAKLIIYRSIILPVALYGCETWTLTREYENWFRVFENKVLRRIHGPKRDDHTGEWRRLHNEELHSLHAAPDILRVIKSRRLRWAGQVAHMTDDRTVYRVMVGNLQGKRPVGRPRTRWADNVKKDLREVGLSEDDWMDRARDGSAWRGVVGAAMDFRAPNATEL
jgi:hypothetical protein